MDSFLYVDSCFSVGAFLNGKLYTGHQGQAGELGFMQISDGGALGPDGRTGLLNSIAPFYKITDRIDEIIAANGNTLVKQWITPESPKAKIPMLVDAIAAGDMLCAELMSGVFKTLGAACLNLAYIFNPEAIFLPPWTARCEACSIDIVRRQLGHYGVHHWGLKTEALSASCGKESLARGAALIPVDRLFDR